MHLPPFTSIYFNGDPGKENLIILLAKTQFAFVASDIIFSQRIIKIYIL